MKKVFFLVNAAGDINFSALLEKHLSDCAIFIGTRLPENTDEFDLVVLWSYRKKVDTAGRRRNIILFHSSRLPEGRGFAPIYNSIALGLRRYTISGLFAADEVDQGELIVRASFELRDCYTASDLRRWDEEISMMLTRTLLQRLDQGPLSGTRQQGTATWWPRRKPEDNLIDTAKPFKELIPHLRACEERHPAFFMLDGTKYLVSIRPEKNNEFPEDLEIDFLDSA